MSTKRKATAKGKRKFKGGVSRNAQKQSKGSQFSYLNLPKNISVFKEDPGSRVSLDLMPYEVTMPNHLDRDDEYEIAIPGSLWYKRPFYLHRNIGPDNIAIVCPTSEGKKCPICEYRAQLLKEGAEWNDDSVKALKASMRNLYWVIPKGSKKYDEQPHIWDISQFLFQEKLNEEIQESEEFETFPDLEDGYTLRIRFSEESFGSNKFADTSRIDFKERTTPYPESILDKIPTLDDILEIKTYKAIQAIFFGGLSPEEVDGDDPDDEELPWQDEDDSDDDQDDSDVDNEEDDDSDSDDYDEEDGEDDDDDEDEDEEEEPEPEPEPEPKKTTRKPAASKTKTKVERSPKTTKKETAKKETAKKTTTKKTKATGECPSGHTFGKDCEEFDECDTCELWEKCLDASENI